MELPGDSYEYEINFNAGLIQYYYTDTRTHRREYLMTPRNVLRIRRRLSNVDRTRIIESAQSEITSGSSSANV